MTAFFFGSTGRPLFGYHHPPRSNAVGAVVVCSPWGREYQFSHRALRVLARRLSERGLHVLRFDYSGTGDSWGDSTEGRVALWLDDIDIAIEELRAMSDSRTVHMVGLRLGALLAGGAAARRHDIDRLVLWDPLASASEWVDSLDLHVGETDSGNTVEMDNQLVSSALSADLRELTVEGMVAALAAASPPERTLVLLTQGAEVRSERALSSVSHVTVRHLQSEAPWREDSSIWSGLIPVNAIAAITDWMAT